MKRHKFYIGLSVIIFIILISAYIFIHPYYNFLTKTLNISPFTLMFSNAGLKTVNNQVNIVILGIGGANHDGPNLSDSITVVHYDFKTNKLTTIGIPRDVWSPTLQNKINSAYAFGEAKEAGGGLKLAKAEVGAIVDLPIDYGAVIDFDKFEKLIDFLGGVDINVQHAFVDHQYPIDGKENDTCNGDPDYKCRYETISFNTGMTHMDGARALKFVRSRHAENSEGSDFARSQRQQLVIGAIKEKIFAIAKSRNINKINELYTKVNSLIERDINNAQLAYIGKNIIIAKNFQQKSIALTTDMFEVPQSSEYNGMYVLIPKNNDYTQIHNFIHSSL